MSSVNSFMIQPRGCFMLCFQTSAYKWAAYGLKEPYGPHWLKFLTPTCSMLLALTLYLKPAPPPIHAMFRQWHTNAYTLGLFCIISWFFWLDSPLSFCSVQVPPLSWLLMLSNDCSLQSSSFFLFLDFMNRVFSLSFGPWNWNCDMNPPRSCDISRSCQRIRNCIVLQKFPSGGELKD